jgi:hypothetical protein
MLPQFAANNRSIIHNRGRVLGSTSALSLLVWNRATVNEYNAWEELGKSLGRAWEELGKSLGIQDGIPRPLILRC